MKRTIFVIKDLDDTPLVRWELREDYDCHGSKNIVPRAIELYAFVGGGTGYCVLSIPTDGGPVRSRKFEPELVAATNLPLDGDGKMKMVLMA